MKKEEKKNNVSVVEPQRLRRITGYLVCTIDRWNSAKKAELMSRVSHISENTKI